jgi:hypothetical protein
MKIRFPNNMTHTTSRLLLFERPEEGVTAMQKSKTHFDQIPVELVKKIAKKDVTDDKDGNDGAETTIQTGELKPYRLASLGKNGKSV